MPDEVPASENPPVSSQSSTKEVLKDVLTKPSENSKKYKITVIGLKLLTGAFVISALICFFKPTVASYIVTMASVYLTAIGGLIGVYLGGQSASEWKASAALAATSVLGGDPHEPERTANAVTK
jgi:uncharacterized membrane protein